MNKLPLNIIHIKDKSVKNKIHTMSVNNTNRNNNKLLHPQDMSQQYIKGN